MLQKNFKKISGVKVYTLALYLLNVLLLSYNLSATDTVNKNSLNQPVASKNIIFHTLPSNYNYRATRCILKDYKGLMWFGTQNGLIRFDGVNLKAYEHDADDSTSIRYNTVNAILEDKNHNLWIGTSYGLNLYNRLHDNFYTIYSKTGQEHILDYTFISSLSAGSDSNLWIGTFSQGLYRYNIYTGQIKHYEIESAGNTNVNITGILSDSVNNLWIGTQSGLVFYDINENRYHWFHNNIDDPLSISSNHISSIQQDCFGNIWVGTLGKGLNLIEKSGNSYTFQHFSSNSGSPRISSNEINKLFADDNGNLWIGTENNGLNKFNINTGKIEVYKFEIGNEKSINSSSVWSIYGDNEGRIWIGSYNKGISVIDTNYSKFESYQSNPYSTISLPYNDVRGFCETNNGKIWIATDGGGICRFDLKTRSFDKLVRSYDENKHLTNNAIQSIILDSGENIWVGSWGGGVDRLTQNGTLIKNYKIESKTGVGNNKINTLYQDKRGNIWVGTNGSGLYIYNENKDQFEIFVYKSMLNEQSYISAIQSDSDSTLWIGTLTGLIYLKTDPHNNVVQAKGFTTDNSSISSNSVQVILIDDNKKIWLGTYNGGANVLNPHDESFRIFRKKDGLSSNNISGILEDDEGNIWISTNAGISRIDINTSRITIYTTADGLNSDEFYSKSCFKVKNGALLFGSEKGFNLIHPVQIKTNPHIPDILLTGLKINNTPVDITTKSSPFNKQLSETDTLILNYKQTSFSIDFVALNYTRPGQNQFAYMLEGYDDDWNYIGTKTTANYTKVKPGKYTFKVKGSNNDGIWNEVPTTLYMVIKPPVWKTNLAYLLYIISIIAFITFIFKAWQERIHIRNQLELERLAKEKEHEMNEKNLQFFTNISHEFRTPLSLIIGPVESLLNSSPLKMHEQLKVIQRNSNRLLSLTNNLMNLRKLEDGGMQLNIREEDIKKCTEAVLDFFIARLKKQNINLSVDIPEFNNLFLLDKEKYTTILINLFSNAIKHTPENGSIRIAIKHIKSTNQLKISVVNTGMGIHPSELPFIFDKFYQTTSGRKQKQFGIGIGLALTKGLVELHGGKIFVNSIPNHETNFTFTIPVNRSAYKTEDLRIEPSDFSVFDTFIDDYEADETFVDVPGKENEKSVVLIVEDNKDLRLFLKRELEGIYTIVLAENGEEGLQKANAFTPDLIISDIVMPIMSGIEFCKAIKTDVRTSHIPLVLLTAKTTTSEQIEGFDTGADAYITKPFHLKLLQTQVANLIQSRKELYAQFSQEVYIMPNKLARSEIDQMFLQKTIDHIIQNLTDTRLNTEHLANHHNMSHSNFYRKIKALTGYTIIKFIRIVRLKQALKLMESKKYNMAEISYMTGFTSPSYFTKNFREYYGKPPSEYLNQ
jgi:signal transduction histidine kinase/ligand-binding sensor domain-containing protein/DNA-binding response OmpR family regulator